MQESNQMILRTLMVTALVTAPLITAHASEWHVGGAVSFPTAQADVLDLYEENYAAQGTPVDVTKLLPFGIAFDAHYQWNSGIRLGMGFGPLLLIAGDVQHFEAPINVTLGYTFLPKSNVSPYVKAGFVHHIANGDFVVGSNPGLLAAVGLEFARNGVAQYALEVASDQSEVEFDKLCARSQPSCRPSTVTLNTYDVVISFIVKFGRRR
jgi:hypothetical protein